MKKTAKKYLQGILPAFLIWTAPMASSVRTLSRFRTKTAVIKRTVSCENSKTFFKEHKSNNDTDPFDVFGRNSITEITVNNSGNSNILNLLKKEGLLINRTINDSIISGDSVKGRKDFAVAVCVTSLGFTTTGYTTPSACLSAGYQWNTQAPTISSSSISDISSSSFKLNIDISASGTVYAVVVLRTGTAPDSTQVKNGQDGTGASAVASASVTLDSGDFSGSITFNVSNADTNIYNVYFIAEDADGMTDTPKYHSVLSETTYTTNTVHTYSGSEYAYSDIEIDSNNNIYVFLQSVSSEQFRIYKWNTSNTSWEVYAVLDKHNDFNDINSNRSDMVVDTNGDVHIIAYCNTSNQASTSRIYHYKYNGSWSDYALINDSGVRGNGSWDYAFADADNEIHLAVIHSSDNNLYYYTNESGSWVKTEVETLSNSNDEGKWTLVESNGTTAHVFYTANNEQDIKTANSSDAFATKTTIIDTSTTLDVGSVAIDSNDKMHLVYSNKSDGTAFYCTNSSGSWTSEQISSDGFSDIEAKSIQLYGNNLYVLMFNDNDDYFYFMRKVSGSWEEGNFFKATNNSSTYLSVFYIDTTNDKIHFVYQKNSPGADVVDLYESPSDLFSTGGSSNNNPTIAISDSNHAYTENTAAIQIDSTATASDADGYTNWDGGKLEVQITANAESGDRLTIPDNQVGNINTSGTSLRDDTTTFATLSASEGTITNNTKLTITFDSNATDDRVSKAAQAIYYDNTSVDPGTSNRTVTFTVTDNSGGSSSDTRTIEVSTIAIPATQATAVTFTSVSANQMTINWTNGNGSKRAVFVKQASSGTCAPSDNTTYTANTVFGSGTQVGSTGWYCVFNSDTGSSATVTGLDSGLTYQVHICEYNGGEGFENYNTTSGASNNPNSQVTPSGTPGLWTGTTDTDWAKGTNWDDSSVPGSEINITVPDVTNQPILDQSRIISDLTLQSSSGLTINEAYTLTASNLEIDDSAVIDITNSAGILVITGTYNKIGTGKIEATNGGMANIKGNVLKEGTERLLIDSSSDGILIKSSIILP